MVFVEVPLDPDLCAGKDNIRIILVIEVVDEDAGHALTGAVSVLDGGNCWAWVLAGSKNNLRMED